MEQHPVPQNVTTFQFRLVGDMTLKQFGYLAAGALLAFICYKLPLPFFFTYPLTAISALLGFGLAFVPVEERPMDVWIMAFLKNVYSPTQWVWQHTKPRETAAPTGAQPTAVSSSGGTIDKLLKSFGLPAAQSVPPATPTIPQAPTTQTTAHVPPKEYPSLPMPASKPADELVTRLFGGGQKSIPTTRAPKETYAPRVAVITNAPARSFLEWLKNIFKSKPGPLKPAGIAYKNVFEETENSQGGKSSEPAPTTRVMPVTAKTGPAAPLTQVKSPEIATLEANLNKLRQELETTKASGAQILELQKKLSEALSSKTQLELEMERLKSAKNQAASVLRPAGTTPVAPKTSPTVRVITPEAAVRVGLPRLTTFPNIVTGIIKDPMGNLLAGILVTVRDKNEVPLRALKSNTLGQFAASTPLPNGNYFIEVEDPRNNFTFDRVQIAVTGALLPPLEIFAKSQKQINRDKLAAEIFGNQKPI